MNPMVRILFILLLGSSNCHAFKVIIDPGHGGTDGGAISEKIKESDITLEISKKIYQLIKLDSQFDAVLTRHKDELVTLLDRSNIAVKEKGQLFLSIHVNSSPDASARGTEFYMQSQMPADEETLFLASRENDETHLQNAQEDKPKGDLAVIIDDIKKTHDIYASQIFAETLISQWKKKFYLRGQPIKQGPFHVLINVPMPSILIEIGFLTNHKELQKLTDSKQQNQMAEVIFKSIKLFKEKIDKSEFSSHSIRHAHR